MAISVRPLVEYQANDEYIKSLYDLSKARQTAVDGSPISCLTASSRAATYKAFNLDAIKDDLCRSGEYPLGGLSADALLRQGEELYLIEFKTSRLTNEEWYRKIYDSVLLLVELGVATWTDCREHLTFITVQTNAEARFPNYDLGKRTGKSYGPIWEYDPADILDPDVDARVLSGQVARKIYRMTPDAFDLFIGQQGWNSQETVRTWVSVMLEDCNAADGPSENSVYPASWSEPVFFPMGKCFDVESARLFLRRRAERFVMMNTGADKVTFDAGTITMPGDSVFKGVCDNPLSADVRWHIAVWMQPQNAIDSKEALCGI